MKQSVNASKSGVSNIVLLANGENPNVKSRAIPCEADILIRTCNDYYVGWRLAPSEVPTIPMGLRDSLIRFKYLETDGSKCTSIR